MKEKEKQAIVKLLKNSSHLKKIPDERIFNLIETPPSSELGDYAFPCFFLASQLKMAPKDIALQIRSDLGKLPKEFSSAETNGPYINFFLNKKSLTEKTINDVLELKEKYGMSDIGKGNKILVEHTSINPNASPHVGRARNAIIGDSLVKILKFLNYKTEVHYYVNDVSKQIAMLALPSAKTENVSFEGLLKKYILISSKVKKSKKLENEVFSLLQKFESGDKKVVSKFNSITKTAVEGQEKILSKLGIKYDFFDFESSYINESREILKELEKTGKLFKDKDGRLILNQEGTSVEGRMKSPVLVLTRSDGTGLYVLRDLAYTKNKMKISKENIIVLGEDQKLYFEQISEALKLLYPKSPTPRVVHYSYITLRGGKKMSTRKGDVVLLEDFLKEAEKKANKKAKSKPIAEKIAIAAVKYSILKNSPNKSISFDLDDALNFEGDTGPYLLYSYARASSIIRKSKQKKKENEHRDETPEEIEKQNELIKRISEFPNVVEKSYNDMNPSHVANYSYELAKSFNEFYHSSKVLGSDDEKQKLSIVEAFRIVIKNSLKLLGIEVVEEM